MLGRLCAFIALSIALHALTLVAYTPRAVVVPPKSDAPRVLDAVLAPAPAPAPEGGASGSDEAAAPEANGEATQTSNTGADQAGSSLPLPEQWYTAPELSQLAHPLALPRLVYPKELAGSGKAIRLLMKLFVDEHGDIRKIEFVEPRRDAAFEMAALDGWHGVRFTPAIKDGIAVKSQKLLELEFTPE